MADGAGLISTADPQQVWQEALRAGLVGLSQDPLNCEVPPALLDGEVTPTSRFFRRNHFGIPLLDASTWRLEIGGLVRRRLSLDLDELKRFGSVSTVAVLECAGNGRSRYAPAVQGEQWGLGAVGNARWTGVRLADVLDAAGVQRGAAEVGFRGADQGQAPGSQETIAFERSMSVADARYGGALLVFAMNDEPLPVRHGYPIRLVVPGRYAVASVKWLTDITVTDRPFDGFFQAEHYVFQWQRGAAVVREPVAQPQVRALVTEPGDGDELRHSSFIVRGVAWSGAAPVVRVMVSCNGGPWQPARTARAADRHSWQQWAFAVPSAAPGQMTIRARATDGVGGTQPAEPEWNRLGYGGNFVHEVTIRLR